MRGIVNTMTIIQLLFYVFATLAVCSGLMVILASEPVHSVLALVLTFFSTAGIWFLLHAEFLALILVLVYVGAVMTLFLFVVMMLSSHMKKREGFVRYLPLGIILVGMIFALMVVGIGPEHFGLDQIASPGLKDSDYNNITDLGMVLYTDYVYSFEISAVLLLTAIIAAITLTHRKAVRRRSQQVNEQVAVRPEDRVRIIKMPSEKKIRPNQVGE